MHSESLFLHLPGKREPIAIKTSAQASIRDALKNARLEGHTIPEDTSILVFEEEDEEPLPESALLDARHKHNRSIVCHACRRIVVRVVFNGTKHERPFAPNRKLAGVLKWALEAFGQKGIDATGMELQLDGHPDEELADNIRLGSLVHGHHCELTLNLILKPRVNG